jgi:hypothetical protein
LAVVRLTSFSRAVTTPLLTPSSPAVSVTSCAGSPWRTGTSTGSIVAAPAGVSE